MLRTETIAAAVTGEWFIDVIDGTLALFTIATRLTSYLDNQGVTQILRAGWQFVWPNTINKSPEGSMLDPPVFASTSIELDTTLITHSGEFQGGPVPKLIFYIALTEAVTLDGTLWPGPIFPTALGLVAPHSSFVVHEFININPRVNGNRVGIEAVSGVNSYSLDASAIKQAMNDQPGKPVWDLNFTIVAVLENEFDEYHKLQAYPEQVWFDHLTAKLSINYVSAHTGFMTNINPTTATRAVRDGRFGRPALSMELVEDKYNLGVQVGIKQQDPDDGVSTNYTRQEQRTDNKGVR